MEVNITKSVGFCEDVFWDSSLVWDTETPYLTECFRETVLVYLPTIFIILTEPVVLLLSPARTGHSVKISAIFLLRIILCLALVSTSVAEFVLSFGSSLPVSMVSLVSSLVRAVTFLLAGCLHVLHNRQGKVTSTILFLFWLLSLVCSLIKLINNFTNSLWEPRPYLTQYTEAPLTLILFFLSCWAEPARSYTFNTPSTGKQNLPSPESTASALSRLTYSWATPFTWRGWKTTLKQEDMWELTPDNG